MTISPQRLEKAAEAAHLASCPDREGPYGLYDYTSYKWDKPHRVRDFRDPRSVEYGSEVFKSDNRDEAEAEYDRLTKLHVARAAISAYLGDDMVVVPREPTADMCEHGSAIDETSEGRTPAITTSQADECYRAMLSAELTERDAG